MDGTLIKFQYNSCYCLSNHVILPQLWGRISIQLLLLFIFLNQIGHAEDFSNFNTTLVIVYRIPSVLSVFPTSISIQLLLLFIMWSAGRSQNTRIISIQLLLLFIKTGFPCLNKLSLFQYNSCYCLSARKETIRRTWIISIQLLLLFILHPRCNILAWVLISIQLLLLFICNWIHNQKVAGQFQYNSCYCLSRKISYSWYSNRKFQYNSCYCLSVFWRNCSMASIISIQLLLLFIQRF